MAALVVAVVNEDKGDRVIDAARTVGSRGRFIIHGVGTASKEIWERLGITKHRDIVVFVTSFNVVEKVIKNIVERFDRKKKNQGMVFATPIDELMEGSMKISKSQVDAQEKSNSQLIMVRMANGYGQEIMDCARKAGALGGTIVNGRIPPKSSEGKFFKITVSEEGDMLFMLVDKSVAGKILEAINAEYGRHTPARAFGFAVPVLTSVMISE